MTNVNRNVVSMDEQVPAEVELRSIGLSFSLAAGKNLSRTWQRELRTELESRFRGTVSREKLEVSFSPAILIDAQWPAMNMLLGGTTIEFATGRIHVAIGAIHGVTEGLVDFSEDAQKEVRALMAAGIAGSAMARPGYNPMTDARIVSTLEGIADNFRKQPSSGKTDVTTHDFGSPRIDVQLATKNAFAYMDESAAGLSMPEGAVIDVSITGRGNLANLTSSRGTAEIVRAAQIESITISSNAISVIVKDKPVAYLDQMRINRGGAVTMERMRLAGTLDEAAGMESLFRVISSALKMTSTGSALDASIAVAANSPESQATIVPQLVRGQIESALTRGVRQLVRAHRRSIAEVDLEEIFMA